MKRLLLLLTAGLVASCQSNGQNIPRTTPFTRSLLLSTNDTQARDVLNIGAGTGDVTAANTFTNGTPLLGGGGLVAYATNASGYRAAIGVHLLGASNVVYVTAAGDDSTALRGRSDLPALTLTRAIELKQSGDVIVMGPGTFDFTVSDAVTSTGTTNRVVSNFALVGAGGLTTVNVIPRGTNEYNRVLSSPYNTAVTNVLFRDFKLDGNASDYAWASNGKLDWVLWGQNITIENVEVVDWGGHSTQEAFSPLLQNVTNAVVSHSVFRSTGSIYTAGPTAMDAAHVRFTDNYVADYNLAFGLVNALYDIEISRNQVTNVNYFVNMDTATSGAMNVRILDNSAVGDPGSAVRGIQMTYGGKQWFRIERNTLAYFPQAIWIRSPDTSGTNYFLNGVVADNFIPASTLLGISVGESTNGFYRNNKVYYNAGSFPATNYVAGSLNYGWGHVKPDGSLWSDLPNTLQGAGGGITYTGSANNGNLATTVDTLQELSDAVDDLVLGSGSVSDISYAASWDGVTNVAPSKNATYDMAQGLNQRFSLTQGALLLTENPAQIEFGNGFVIADGVPNQSLVTLTNFLLQVATNSQFGTGPLLGRDVVGLTSTINAGTNLIDWTMIKNVPAGIADGDDAEGAAGSGDDVFVNHANVTHPNITNSADITWSVSGTNVTAALAANSVALTTDTTGDYVATIGGDTEIVVSGAGTEGRAVTLSIGSAMTRDSELATLQTGSATLTNLSNIGGGASGDVLYRDANRWTNLVKGTDGQVLKLASGLPSWAADASGGVNWADVGTTNASLPGIAYAHGGVFTNDLSVLGTLTTDTNVVTNLVVDASATVDLDGVTSVLVPTIAGTSDNDTSAASTAFVQAVSALNLTEAEASALYQATNSTTTRFAGIGAGTSGDILFRDATGWTNLAKSTDGLVLKLTSGFPAWQTDASAAGGETAGTVHALNDNDLSVDNALVRVHGTGGTNVQKSVILLDDNGALTAVSRITATNDINAGSLSTVTNVTTAAVVATNSINQPNVTASRLAMYDANKFLTNSALAESDIVTETSTETFQNKTLDAAGTGNVLKQTKYILLQRPDYGDGAGAIPQTNSYVASGLMHYTLSGNAETNANWIVYEFDCPADLDTGVAMTATFSFLSGGTDTDDYVFHLTYGQVAAGTAYPTGTGIASLPIVMTVNTATEANGDIQQSSATTLTGWAAALTPGVPMTVRVARLQNTQDDGARDVSLRIAYGSTQ